MYNRSEKTEIGYSFASNSDGYLSWHRAYNERLNDLFYTYFLEIDKIRIRFHLEIVNKLSIVNGSGISNVVVYEKFIIEVNDEHDIW